MLGGATLGAILIADLEGFARLASRDEAMALAFVDRCLRRARRAAARFDGEVIKGTGDGWLALFPSATAAVACARVTQRLIRLREPDPPALFRMGVHAGELRRSEGDVHGHTVNVAARVEPLSEPGGVVVTQAVVDQLGAAGTWRFAALGRPRLKNIGDDIRVYRLVEARGAAPPVTTLRVEAAGGLRLSASDGAPAPLPKGRRAALLAALAVAGDEPVPAARLAALLWPDRSAPAARAALGRARRALNRLLAAAAPETIVADSRGLRLHGAVEVDLGRIERALAAGEVDPALLRSDDPAANLLSGLEAPSRSFAAWLEVRRTIWRETLVARLEHCLGRHPPERPVARAAAEALLRIEPGHERASRALMRHLAANERVDAALREYDRLRGYLAETHGSAPGESVTELARELTAGRAAAAAAEAPEADAPRLPEVAVGEFGAAGDAAGALAEGFRSELLANLSRFRHWATLDAADGDPAELDYALLGRCAEAADGHLLSVRLVERRSRRVAWSESFRLTGAAWEEIQRRVVGRVAAALEIYLSADRLARSIGRRPDAEAAYDDWLRGEELLLRWTPEAEDEAGRIFRGLSRRAPRFAPAHASLASILNVRHIVRPGAPRAGEETAQAHGCARRAVELDPMDARNHLALAWAAALTASYDEAMLHLDLAASLNPCSPTTTISAAMGYAFLGAHGRAGRMLDEAVALAPMLRDHQWCYAAAVRFLGGDPAGAAEAAMRSGDRIVDNQGWLAAALARLGRPQEAGEAFRRLARAAAADWAGEGGADAEAVHAWFVNAYPIRRERDRAALDAALREAMAGAGRHAAVSGSGGR